MQTQIYQIDHMPSMALRIWRGIRIQLLFPTTLIFLVIFYSSIFSKISGILIGLSLIIPQTIIYRREDRQLVSVCFNEDENTLIIQYFQFCKTHTVKIPVEFLNYTYRPEQYGKGSGGMTLSFYNDDKLVGRIMEKFGYGWKKEMVLEMNQRLALIKNPSHKKYYNGKLH